jgi:hypothetical protein
MKPTPPPEHDPAFLNITQLSSYVFPYRDDMIIHEQLLLQTHRHRLFRNREQASQCY